MNFIIEERDDFVKEKSTFLSLMEFSKNHKNIILFLLFLL